MASFPNLPVLIYISKQGCPACNVFDKQWETIKSQLNGKAILVKFVCDRANLPPPALSKYSGWFPSIVLAGPNSYYRVFTHDDKINDVDYQDNYVIKGKKFNAVETSRGYEFGGRPNSSQSVVTWFQTVSPTVSEFDEKTPPRKYSQY